MKQAKDLSDEIHKLLRLVRSRQFRNLSSVVKDQKIGFPQISLLNKLHHKGPMKVSDFSSYLQVSNAAVSQMTEKLVKAGYITRAEDSTDRRVRVLELSDEGRKMVEDLNSRGDCWIDRISRSFSEDEQIQIVEALSLLNSRIGSIQDEEEE